MRRIRIAQIGVNQYSHGPEMFTNLTQLSDIFEVVGYALVEDERERCADKLHVFEGYPELSLEEILNDETIEAVTVEVDEIHLNKYTQMAVDAGKHIHMEKPGSQDLASFEKLIDSVKKSGKVFHIGYMYRYNEFLDAAVKDAQDGKFGTIFSVEAHMSRWDNKTTREWLGTFKGGMMFYLGCHLVDLVLRIQGTPDEVIPANVSSGIAGVDTEDVSFAMLKYPHGVSIIRTTACEVGGFFRRQLVICGSKRTLEIKPIEGIENGLYTEQTDKVMKGSSGSYGEVEHKRSEPFSRYYKMLSSFAAMVRGECDNPYSPDYELELYKTILKCCGVEN
ncbi:MAG: Gfo/Idh/MocA family oxidoreductase [Clostridia bacterium]|nr:Gfo/Idh/MocA family oxidoreductase [Clostridia bacterium]